MIVAAQAVHVPQGLGQLGTYRSARTAAEAAAASSSRPSWRSSAATCDSMSQYPEYAAVAGR